MEEIGQAEIKKLLEWMQGISVSRHPVKSEEDVYRLRIPDVKHAGLIPFAMEFAKLLAPSSVKCIPRFK